MLELLRGGIGRIQVPLVDPCDAVNKLFNGSTSVRRKNKGKTSSTKALEIRIRINHFDTITLR
jgi:hypothetical protein